MSETMIADPLVTGNQSSKNARNYSRERHKSATHSSLKKRKSTSKRQRNFLGKIMNLTVLKINIKEGQPLCLKALLAFFNKLQKPKREAKFCFLNRNHRNVAQW